MTSISAFAYGEFNSKQKSSGLCLVDASYITDSTSSLSSSSCSTSKSCFKGTRKCTRPFAASSPCFSFLLQDSCDYIDSTAFTGRSQYSLQAGVKNFAAGKKISEGPGQEVGAKTGNEVNQEGCAFLLLEHKLPLKPVDQTDLYIRSWRGLRLFELCCSMQILCAPSAAICAIAAMSILPCYAQRGPALDLRYAVITLSPRSLSYRQQHVSVLCASVKVWLVRHSSNESKRKKSVQSLSELRQPGKHNLLQLRTICLSGSSRLLKK